MEPVYLTSVGAMSLKELRKAVVRVATANKAGSDPVLNKVYAKATQIQDALKSVGIPEPAASYGVYATYHETQAYNNLGARKLNNYSGIKFAGQRGARKVPQSIHAAFDSINDWARAYKHEITKGANAAGAGSLEDFATRLKQNRYFGAPLAEYINGMKRARYVLKSLPATQRAGYDPGTQTTQARQDLDIPGSTDYSSDGIKEWWKGLKTWQKGGLIAGVALVGVAIIKK